MSSPEGSIPKGSGFKETIDFIGFDDPLYLHPADSAVITIVGITLIGFDNFRVWKSSMIRALKGRNKLCFVDGSYNIPNEKDEKNYNKWERVNAIVCSWILSSVSESIYSNHACSEIASEIWDELRETYQKFDGPVIFNVHQRINSLVQNGFTVSEYFLKLDSLWKEFDSLTNLTECACDANTSLKNHSKLMKLMQFLNGLDEGYNQIKSHILLMEPLPSVRTTFSIVSRKESLQKCGSLSSSSSKFVSQPSAFVSRFNVSMKNDERKGFNNKNISSVNNMQCKHYGIKGHAIERCFKLIGYPKDFKFRNGNNSQFKSESRRNNKSFVNTVSVSTLSNDSSPCKVSDNDKFFLTGEQYAKIISLINGNTAVKGVTANMTGGTGDNHQVGGTCAEHSLDDKGVKVLIPQSQVFENKEVCWADKGWIG